VVRADETVPPTTAPSAETSVFPSARMLGTIMITPCSSAPITAISRYPTTRTPAVGHQRPRTSR
jgi:hypothetical protein